ncbi:transmembrane protein 231-like [Battus philenor]|uniref:transmembrane protein 231-like n=1 Tax=Battus philenor TaxID=42288 RepID=UPI0035D03A5D
MGLYQLYSHNAEIKYKSYFFSKATLFTSITTLMNVILPFLVAYRSRGFWLKSHSFYERPITRATFDYLIVATTVDPSRTIICGDATGLNIESNNENCAEAQIQEHDYDIDSKTDMIQFQFKLNVSPENVISSVILILAIDFQLQTICELHMQSLAIISKEFTISPSEFYYYGDLEFYQTSHLPCLRNVVDTRFNNSLFELTDENEDNIIDFIIKNYYKRSVTTQTKLLFSKNQGVANDVLNLNIVLRVPEMHIRYEPSIMQELKWAWPQYLSLVAIFYWLFSKVKKFVFNKRLLMAWKIVPWKKE